MKQTLWLSLVTTLLLAAAGCRTTISIDGDSDADADGDQEGDADGDGDSDADADGDGDGDADGDQEGDADIPDDCPRRPGEADRTRYVVISHPYTPEGTDGTSYEVLELSAAGELSQTGRTFEMGRSPFGTITFTPDGELGLVAQDDGTVGVFALDEAGEPTVLDPALAGDFWAASVVMDPATDGSLAWIIDSQWDENGGGFYGLALGCEGELTDEGRVLVAHLPAAVSFLRADLALLAADRVLESTAGDTAHLLSWGLTAEVLDGADAFGDDGAIVSAMALTADGQYGLIGDNSMFSGVPNRVAVVSVDEASGVVEPQQVLTPIEDPFAIVTSPYDDAALVVSGTGDALLVLSYDPDAVPTPFTLEGELEYLDAGPLLPGGAVMIERGTLTGLVLVSELHSVRLVAFTGDGGVEDRGSLVLGDDSESMVGTIGVQP